TNYGNLGFGAYYMIDDVSVEQICTPFWSYRDTTVTLGDSVLIGPAITGLNINWYDASGTFITNAPGIYVKPNSPTFYTASEDFCNGVISHTVNVMVTPTWIKEYENLNNALKLSPNPTTNNFVISTLTETAQLKVDILDVQGKLISSEIKNISNYNVAVDTDLHNGIYFVNITDVLNGNKTVKKLVVQK
ncbi:MAG: Secretion system C-terminal sorting domain, partial [Bacteroidota bacterium]|nr:Secretion system C-terminal sorting domain [Bacteroidota bacterium]